jgi:acyl-coenzyme A synthetase/AMP-(fatty) acid ligase
MASLRARLAWARPDPARRIEAPDASLSLCELATASGLGPLAETLAGRSVLVRTTRQIGAAQALLELDGLARRLVLCPPDLAAEHLPYVLRIAEVEAIVADVGDPALETLGLPVVRLEAPCAPIPGVGVTERASEWLLFTSGTTGVPKLVAHSLAALTGAIAPAFPAGERPVWATFYDIRRYGGLQVLLRTLTGGCALALCDRDEPLLDHLRRLDRFGVTHMTGTPSHWRRLLMGGQPGAFQLAYVRLSGEIADQPVLDGLRSLFPHARIVHAYASTEAGVVFEVDDGREGFPADFVGRPGPIEMKVADGSLRVRSPQTATHYVGPDAGALVDAEGFVDTGDIVEMREGRCRFAGRRNGVINVGGLKVHPEEVEAVINRHPAVRISMVRARANPITGAVVTADVTLVDPDAAASAEGTSDLRESILAMCRSALPPHKAPAAIRFVPELKITAGGKLDRSHA